MNTEPSADPRQADLGELMSGIVGDARELVEAEVVVVKDQVAARVSQLETWLIIGCVGIVALAVVLLAVADTLSGPIGLPRYLATWIVAAVAVGALIALIVRARREARRAAEAGVP